MQCSLTRVFLALGLGASVIGCGGGEAPDPGARGDSAPRPSDSSAVNPPADPPPSGGLTSGANPFRAFIHVSATASDATKPTDVPVLIDVEVVREGAPVTDAVVTAGSVGRAVRASSLVAGRYVVEETGYAPWYEVSIASGDTTLSGVRLRAPALHTVSVPSRPSKGEPALVRWTPSHDAVVDDLQVRVFGWDEQKITYDGRASDSGELLLPATALPSRTAFAIQIRRGASQALALPNSVAIVDITSTAEIEVR